MTGDKMRQIVRESTALGLTHAAEIAEAIDSNRGNEKEIARACREAARKVLTGEIYEHLPKEPNK